MKCHILALLLLASAVAVRAAENVVTPLTGVHAHNDYEHARPLFDALDQGFTSVEADIHLVDGQLLVAHDRSRVKPERTLQALYLDPIRARVQANGGRVFRDGPEFFLLIDFKGEPGPTWAVLRRVLEGYAGMLTVFREDSVKTNAVTVILTGNNPRALLAPQSERLAAIDGRLSDLETNPSPRLVPWISENWLDHFQWRGRQAMPAAEKTKLKTLLERAHAQGRKVRFWGGPDFEAFWKEELADGVDFINTDKLAGLAAFLRMQASGRP